MVLRFGLLLLCSLPVLYIYGAAEWDWRVRLSCLAYREADKGDCVRTDMLQEFIVWAESKTIEAAAKEMHISQSTLSKHLIALEADGDKLDQSP